jgi:hypothetical protein
MDDWLQAEDEIHAEHDEARNADRAHWPQPITRTAK